MRTKSASLNDSGIYENPLDDDRIRRKSEIIRDLVYNEYDARMSKSGQNYRYKELAGIVLWNNLQPNQSFVVSLGTGTKCINGERIGLQGIEIVDMHAEIIARRGLVHFLYYLLADNIMGRDNILEKITSNYFRIDPKSYEFHLFITSAPCGDSRVFLTSTNSEQTNDPHPNRKCRGLLRTKIESGAGTIPISDPSQQCLDAVRDGKSLKIMSCSDKIAKWNLLGLQGTLLSKYIKPVYLSSIIIGSFFEYTHMKRAMYDRLANIRVSRPFQLNKPLLVGFNDIEVQESSNINFSFSYTYYFGNELIGPSGQLITSVKSRFSQICRRSFFQMFLEIEKMLGLHEHSNKNDFFEYQDVKFSCKLYVLNKQIFYEYLQNHEIGTWLNKSSDMNRFLLPIQTR